MRHSALNDFFCTTCFAINDGFCPNRPNMSCRCSPEAHWR
jgi:hypothetical protein